MNIPPILEQLLLSNEAVFKNATLGISGQNMVFCPPGKSIVLLEVSIEPFINQVGTAFMQFLTDGVGTTAAGYDPGFRLALRRMHYQLQIINDTYSTYINLADKLIMNTTEVIDANGGSDRYKSLASLEFTGKREELFIYADRSMYFNFLYPFKTQDEGPVIPGIRPAYGAPSTTFLPKIQVLPDQPVTFYKNVNEDYVANVEILSSGFENYYPCNHQTNPGFGPELNQMEYLRYFNRENANTIQMPVGDGVEMQFHDLLSVPFINVKYALLNKRPEDYGITRPGK